MDKDFKVIPPFRRCVIQNFPFIEEDFDALTNYGLLSKIVEYLNAVIKSQNEVTEEVEYLANAYNQLKNYVDHYFDNLDVQEEVDKKLDEMAESGQLADIIAQYLGLAGVLAFDTIADLAGAENVVAGSIARVLGNTNYADGDGAFYRVRALVNTDVVDGVNLVAITKAPTLVAERIPDAGLNTANTNISNLTTRVTTLESHHMVVIGDSFSTATYCNPADSWYTLVGKRLNLTVHNYAKDGAGYNNVGVDTTTFDTEADRAIADTSFDNNDVDLVIVYGGLNDMSDANCDYIKTNGLALFNKLSTNFPKAKLVCAGINVWPNGFWVKGDGRTTANFWAELKSECRQLGLIFINTMYWLMTDDNRYYDMTNYHPNAEGNKVFATNFMSAMFGNTIAQYEVIPLTSSATTGSGTIYVTMTQNTLKIEGALTTSGGVAVVPIPKHFLANYQGNDTVIGVTGNYTVGWMNRDTDNFTMHASTDDTFYFGFVVPLS